MLSLAQSLFSGAILSYSTEELAIQLAKLEGLDTTVSSTKSLGITFEDCGNNAHSVVTSVTPNSLPLGGQTCFTGKGTNNFVTTSASWTMKMTGVGGITLLNCKGDDASKPAQCNIGLGPIHVGKASYAGLSFPFQTGDLSLDNMVCISLPTGLPSFALSTVTTLTATAQDGQESFCVKIMSAPTYY